ncbi:5'-3' exonuclease [Nakamurella flava]|uniref:5'-3' exonuclease n=1 Tax=Nakamurella flava TaxID=2576308 RepID=A0A4U6QLA4_9ACTN|nr:5'-3' exonuclease [Nakamurella flava]TKV60898.1 5'-3' exonuclease [Nakamurella flava]
MLQLFDLAGIYFRAFYAVPSSVKAPDGRPVNAIRGTLDILARVIGDARPTRAVACLDLDWRPAWRVELIPTYKTHRVLDPAELSPEALADAPVGAGVAVVGLDVEDAPDDLSAQVPVLLEVLAAIGLATAGAPHHEADDVIGALAAREQQDPVEVVTGDRDLFQVATDGPPPVAVRYIGAGMSKAAVYTPADVAARYGIPPGCYADFAALRGDPSDGLPGVPGVGEKTAATLIGRFGSLEALVAALDSDDPRLTRPQRAKLAPARAYLQVAGQVTRVAVDAPVELDRDDRLPAAPADPDRLAALVAEFGIGGAVGRLTDMLDRVTG